MSKGKIIGISALALIVIIVAAVVFLLTNLDSIVKQVVEKAGTHVTQSEVSLSQVNIGLTEGTGSLSGLTVANPKGFSNNAIFSMENISIKIDTATLTQDPIVIPEIIVRAPKALYEIDAKGNSNLTALKNNVRRASKGSSEGVGPKESSAGPKIIIRKLVIESGQADIKLNALVKKEMTAKLPRIQLNNIGEKTGGASPAEIGEKVISAMNTSLSRVVSSTGVENLIDNALQEKLGGATGAAKEALESGADQVGKEAGEAIKGLFGDK